jgi:ATPase family protein associated with various cellular activities (AAA)/winged helix domain-containing protein
MTDCARDGFRDELDRLDLLVHREILRLRAGYQLSLDELRGLYVSDEQVDALVGASRPPGDGAGVAELSRAADERCARIGNASPLGPVAEQLGLTAFERDALLVAFAPELDLKYEALYAYLNNASTRRHATVDLIVRLCARAATDRQRLHASSPLLRDGLLEAIDAAGERRPELARELTVAPALQALLLGLPPFDPALAGWVEPAETRAAAHVPLGEATRDSLERLVAPLRAAAQPPALVLLAAAADAPEAAAAHLMRRLGRGLLRVGSAAPDDKLTLAALTLTARLRRDGVFVDLEEWSTEARRIVPGLVATLWRARVPVVLSAAPTSDWRPLVRDLPLLRVRLNALETRERRALWRHALAGRPIAEAEEAIADVAEHFRLGPAQIAGAARALALDGDDALAAPRRRLFDAARAQSSDDLGHLALPVPHRHGWDDLVLPPVLLRRLREVTDAIAARARVFDEWGFGRRGGRGLMVLFAGTSGTGKTMSAAVIAREIGLELHRVELASIVSKYIGETEKNLSRIFEAARTANVMLFFDEADALLGRRSEVKDAHDRYANIEVAYLLQKMEEHDGVVILASNLSKNMDSAFARRMHYVVEFPRPETDLRERLWRGVFPREVPLADDVDFAFLARQFQLSGGDIKTIALDAAFLAAGQRRAVAMADLVGAVSRQMLKQGRPLGASDFKQYHGSVIASVGQ